MDSVVWRLYSWSKYVDIIICIGIVDIVAVGL